jgi:hypothetical protein
MLSKFYGAGTVNTKQMLIQELDSVPDDVLAEVLDFLRFLKAKEDKADIEDARAALEEAAGTGTTSLHDIKRELGI